MNNFVATHECDTGYDTFQDALNFIGKTDDPDKWRVCEMVEDMRKAISYLNREIAKRCEIEQP